MVYKKQSKTKTKPKAKPKRAKAAPTESLAKQRDRLLSIPAETRPKGAITDEILHKTEGEVYSADDEERELLVGGVEYKIPPGVSSQPFIVAHFLKDHVMGPSGSFLKSLHGLDAAGVKQAKADADHSFDLFVSAFVGETMAERAREVKPFIDAGATPPAPNDKVRKAQKYVKSLGSRLRLPSAGMAGA